MGQKIASLYAEIGADTSGLTKGLTDTKSALTASQGNLKDFGRAGQEIMGDFAKVTGVATGAAVIFKQAMEFGAEGAQIEFTREKFDRLSASIGTTGDALLNDLKPAMGGIMSESELVSAATDLLTLGLANSHEEAVRLTTVAGQLGMNMNQLVLTLTNQTTMRFDALGISVAGFDEKVAALEETGMSAEAAFNEAFLQQAEEQIGKVGSVADSSAADFMRMEAAIADAGDALKLQFLPILADAAAGLTTILNALGLGDTVSEHADQVAKTATSYAEYTTEAERAANAAGMYINASGDLINMHGAMVEQNFIMKESEFALTQEVERQTAALREQESQLKALDGQTANTYVYNHTIQVAGSGQIDNVSGVSGTGTYVSGRRAAGGPVFAGQSYLVGEKGPEVVTMGGNGNVTPNNQLMGADIGAKIDAMNANIDRLNRTLPMAMKDAILLMGASSGR